MSLIALRQSSVTIRTTLQPGDAGWVVYLHGKLYAEEYGLDHTFEGYVAERIGQFVKAFDEARDYFGFAELDGKIVGCVAIDGHTVEAAQLRFFLVTPEARGSGIGKALLNDALRFCRSCNFPSVFLWTISDLKAAAHLYREAGFRLTGEKTHEIWGAMRTEQTFELTL